MFLLFNLYVFAEFFFKEDKEYFTKKNGSIWLNVVQNPT